MRTGFFRQAVWLALVALLPAAFTTVLHPKAPAWTREAAGAPEVSTEWVRDRGARVLWVDARREPAFRRDGITGAVRLNEDRWDDLMPNFLTAWHPERVVVVYCDRHCHSSQEVARRLRREMNVQNIVVLRGGREAWRDAPSP